MRRRPQQRPQDFSTLRGNHAFAGDALREAPGVGEADPHLDQAALVPGDGVRVLRGAVDVGVVIAVAVNPLVGEDRVVRDAVGVGEARDVGGQGAGQTRFAW